MASGSTSYGLSARNTKSPSLPAVIEPFTSSSCDAYAPCITLDQAMKICTIHGAYASHEEDVKGSITAGKLGDFVLLAESPYDVDPDSIKEIQIARTVVGGRTVFEA